MKQLLNLLETTQQQPLHTMVLIGAGRASTYAAQASRLAHTVVLVDADAATCQANQQYVALHSNWQVVQATIAPQAGPANYHSFNASRFNGLLPMEQLANRPANLKQTNTTPVQASTLGDLLQQLELHTASGGCALLIDIGDTSLPVLASVQPAQLAGLGHVGLALHSAPSQFAHQQRLQMARQLGLQMLGMHSDAAGHEPCYLYECDAVLCTPAASVEMLESPEPVELTELRQKLADSTVAYEALMMEMDSMKMVHNQLLDHAAEEIKLLNAEIDELKQRHKKFNEHMVRAESQLDLIKTLLFRDQSI